MALMDFTEVLPRWLPLAGKRGRRLPASFFDAPPPDQADALDRITMFGVSTYGLKLPVSQPRSQPRSQTQPRSQAQEHAAQSQVQKVVQPAGAQQKIQAASEQRGPQPLPVLVRDHDVREAQPRHDPYAAYGHDHDHARDQDQDYEKDGMDDAELLFHLDRVVPEYADSLVDELSSAATSSFPDGGEAGSPITPRAGPHTYAAAAADPQEATSLPRPPPPLPRAYDSSSPAPMPVRPVRRSLRACNVFRAPEPRPVVHEVEEETDEDDLSDYERQRRRSIKATPTQSQHSKHSQQSQHSQRSQRNNRRNDMHISEPTQDIIDDPYFDESIPQSQGSSQMNLQRFVSAHDMEFEEESEGMHVVVSHTQGTRVVETEEIEEPEPEVEEALPEQHGEPEELEEPEPQLDPEPESSSERRVVLVATTDESDPLPRAATGARTQSSPAHPPSSGAAPPAQRRKRARDSVATNASADADVEDDAPPRAKRMRDQLVTQATPARYAYTPLMPSTPATPASGMVTARRFVPDTNRSEASMRSARSSPSPAQPRSAKQSLQPSPTGTLHWKPNLRVPGLKGAAVRRMAEQARRERARLEEIRRVKMERK